MKNGIFWTLCLLSFSAWSQLPDHKILWKASQPLEWKDFEGKPESGHPFQASTSTAITYSWSLKTRGEEIIFGYEVYSFFLPEGSWFRPGSTSGNLLAHEQLHFDITELHARKLRKKLKDFDPKVVKDVKKVLGDLYHETEAGRKAMQEQFDRETDHSQRENVQTEWQKKIAAELAALEGFSS